MNEYLEIKNAIGRYKCFQECILTSINFSNNLTSAELSFNYIYDRQGVVRSDIDKIRLVSLKLDLVQAYRMDGGFNHNHLSNPEMINWGLNEISIINVFDNSELLREYVSLNTKFHHLEILWETKRRIDIVFNAMEIFEGLAPTR